MTGYGRPQVVADHVKTIEDELNSSARPWSAAMTRKAVGLLASGPPTCCGLGRVPIAAEVGAGRRLKVNPFASRRRDVRPHGEALREAGESMRTGGTPSRADGAGRCRRPSTAIRLAPGTPSNMPAPVGSDLLLPAREWQKRQMAGTGPGHSMQKKFPLDQKLDADTEQQVVRNDKVIAGLGRETPTCRGWCSGNSNAEASGVSA